MSTMYDAGGAVGLGVPWAVLDEEHRSVSSSSLSSLSAIPAPPVPDQDTDALLVALNEWETPPSSGTGFVVRVQQGGNVGPAGATWGWRDSSEAATSLRGHAWPTYARRMWATLARAGETAGRSDWVTLPSGRAILVQGVRTASAEVEIRAGWIEEESLTGGTAATEIVLVSEDSAHATYEGWDLIDAHGRMSVDYWEEEDRVLCAVLYKTGGSTPLCQVAIYESTDEGAGWSLRAPRALVAPFSDKSSYGNIVLRRVGGSWSLLIEYTDGGGDRYTAQYAGTSPDHFILLEDAIAAVGTAATGLVEISGASDGDGLTVLGVAYDTGARTDIVSLRLGSAWQPLSEAEQVSLTDYNGGAIAGFYPAAVIDPDGTMWAVFLDAGQQYIYLVYSIDRGESWLPAGYHPLETAANANMQYIGLGLYRGGCIVSFAADNGGDWVVGGLRGFAVALGGWDNNPLPYLPAAWGNQARLGYGRRYGSWTWGVTDTNCLSWFPPVLLTATGPAGALTGAAPTATAPDGAEPYLVFADAGAGSYVTWTPTGISYSGNGMVAEADAVLDVAGTSVIGDNTILQVRLPDVAGGGANIIEVAVQADATSFRLYDVRAGATLSTVALPGTTRRKYRLSIVGTRVALRYREPGSQVWAEVTATTSSGASAAVERVRCGATTTNGQSIRFYSVEFVGTAGPQGTRDPSRAITAANILGRPASARGVPVYLGYQLAWRRGPLHPGHTWTATSTAKFAPGLVGARDYPSPSDRWRSSTDNVEQDFVWEPAGGQLWRPPGSVFFLLLWADGVESLTVSGRDGAGVFQTLITATPGSGLSALSYSAPTAGGVTGGSLRPNTTGNAANRPFREGELTGGWVQIATSGAAYRITGNTPGFWGPSGDFKPTIYVDGWDGAEPNTGTFSIIPPVSLHVAPEMNPSTGYDQIRIRIPATANTVAGRYEVKAVLGSVFVPGRRYSYGRTPSVEPIARGVETAGGRSFYDPNQPIRRFARFAWSDPYGTRGLHSFSASTGPNALLLASGGTQAVALVDQTHRDLEGVLRLLGGPGRTLVYLPRVEAQLTPWMTSDPDRWLYGRITSALTTPRPYGDEGVREEVMVSELTVQEEV